MSDRKETYRALLEQYSIDPENGSTTAGEDAAEYLNGDKEIKRFCVVTHSGEYHYTYPDYDTFQEAADQAISLIGDTCYAECPVSIINLDINQQWSPDFSGVKWFIPESETKHK